MKEKTKRKLIAALAIATGSVGSISVATHMAIYDKFFSRYERPDYSLTPGLYNYELIKDLLPREEIFYLSDDVLLKGYYYKAKSPKGLVVVCHGIHAGGDDYLPIIEYLIKNNFNVFSFDYKGTYDSKGDSTVGMCESLVDLDHTLDFINDDNRLNKLPLFLLGHSWGGYAVTSVLSKKKNIKAVASIAGLCDGYNIIYEKGHQYAGKLASLSKPFLDVYQRYLFKDYVEYNALRGINESNIPVLIAHGVDDNVISFDKQSIISKKNEITNPNVEYYIGKGVHGGHDDIWHSKESYLYKLEVQSELKYLEYLKGSKLDDEEKRKYVISINHRLYSDINKELLDKIISMFNRLI